MIIYKYIISIYGCLQSVLRSTGEASASVRATSGMGSRSWRRACDGPSRPRRASEGRLELPLRPRRASEGRLPAAPQPRRASEVRLPAAPQLESPAPSPGSLVKAMHSLTSGIGGGRASAAARRRGDGSKEFLHP